MVIPLSNINPGDWGRIVCLADNGPLSTRLEDLGFRPGARVSCVLQKRSKHIAAYLVQKAVIALRAEDSCLIMVEPCEEEINGGEVVL